MHPRARARVGARRGLLLILYRGRIPHTAFSIQWALEEWGIAIIRPRV